MSETTYKLAWEKFSESPTDEYSTEEIENLIGGQVKEVYDGTVKYLQTDLILKSVTILVLVILNYLYRGSSSSVILLSGMTLGVLASLSQSFLVRSMKQAKDYGLPVKKLLTSVYDNLKNRIPLAGFLIGYTNPLIILAGSFIYYYTKYGEELNRNTEDFLVTMALLAIGFVAGSISFTIQQESLLTDLELSKVTLETADNAGLEKVIRRRKRRQFIIVSLMILGTIVFLASLGLYLTRI